MANEFNDTTLNINFDIIVKKTTQKQTENNIELTEKNNGMKNQNVQNKNNPNNIKVDTKNALKKIDYEN